MVSTHQPVIDGLTTLYQTLVDMQYLPSNMVIHPPYKGDTEETTINAETAADVGFDEEVIQLMQNMPYITGDSDDWYVAPNTHPVCYLKEWRVEDGRDPLGNGRRDLPPHAIALSWGGPYGTFLIYDTKTSEITEWSPDSDDDDDETKPRSASPQKQSYTNLPTTPASEVLSRYNANFRELKWIPLNGNIIDVADEKEKEEESSSTAATSTFDDLKKVYKDCGWPKKLDAEMFAEKKKMWEEESFGKYKLQMEEDRKRAMEEAADED